MGNLSFFENMINSKLLSMHTAYIAKVLSTNGKTAKIQPLGMTKEYGGSAKAQAPLSNVPILQSARWKYEKERVRYVSDVSVSSGEYVVDVTPKHKEIDVLVPKSIAAGDLVLCVCCERDISAAKQGSNSVPPVGHHSMSASVIVGIL